MKDKRLDVRREVEVELLEAHDKRMGQGCLVCRSAVPGRICPDCYVCRACAPGCNECIPARPRR